MKGGFLMAIRHFMMAIEDIWNQIDRDMSFCDLMRIADEKTIDKYNKNVVDCSNQEIIDALSEAYGLGKYKI
ncbi:hypothetical protein J6A31_00945 [bacterium]|nr:hypothetical protein [bacterium]